LSEHLHEKEHASRILKKSAKKNKMAAVNSSSCCYGIIFVWFFLCSVQCGPLMKPEDYPSKQGRFRIIDFFVFINFMKVK